MLRMLIAVLLLAGCSVCYPCSELRKEDGVWYERRCDPPSEPRVLCPDIAREEVTLRTSRDCERIRALQRQREELDAIVKQAREAFERGDRLK